MADQLLFSIRMMKMVLIRLPPSPPELLLLADPLEDPEPEEPLDAPELLEGREPLDPPDDAPSTSPDDAPFEPLPSSPCPPEEASVVEIPEAVVFDEPEPPQRADPAARARSVAPVPHTPAHRAGVTAGRIFMWLCPPTARSSATSRDSQATVP
jgi:hypothetical protein